MFLPLYSDSEMRCWPFLTGSLIILNIICFLIMPNSSTFVLSHGDGLHPLQWLTSFFLHDGLIHLLGNMVFLWIFGHIVEGVVGHWKFAALYLGMGIFQNFLEQVLYLGSDGGASLGASSAIYAIMLLAAWFAPQDNIQCVVIFYFRAFFFSVPVLMMALFYFLFDLAISSANGFVLSTPLLHSLGGLIGCVVGFILLQTGLVENDRRDALSMFHDARGKSPHKAKRKPAKHQLQEAQNAQEAARLARAEERRVAEQSFLMHLSAGNIEAVLNQHQRLKRLDSNYQWNENQLLQLIGLAQKNADWPKAISLAQTYLELFNDSNPEKTRIVRLNLATILLKQHSAPLQARKVLMPLRKMLLSPEHQQTFRKLMAESDRQIDEGELELAED